MLNSTTSEPEKSPPSSSSDSEPLPLPSSPPPQLNPVDKIKLAAAAEEEKRRRIRERQSELRRTEEDQRNPSPVLKKGDPFNDLWLPAPFITYYGGRDARKSWSVAEYLVRLLRSSPQLWLCTREFQSSVKDSVHRLLRNTIQRLWFGDQFHITDKSIKSRAGGEFIFKGLRIDPDGVKGTEGLHGAWVEEGQHTTDDSWEILIPTVMRRDGGKIITTYNVTDEDTPTHRRLILEPQPGSISHLVNYDSNPFLSENSKRAIAHLKATDYEAYLHVYKGLAKKISDAIIFGGRYKVEDFPHDLWKKADRLFFGLDHGFARDPYALVRFFIWERRLYIEFEAFGVGVEFAGNMVEGRGELEQLVDSVPGSREWPIKADNSRPETISFLAGKGFNVSAAAKWKKCVEDGIAHIKGFEQTIIHPRCKHMAEEARLYAFKKDRMTGQVLPIVVDKNNHGWDAVRYGLDGYIQTGGLAVWEKLGEG